MDWKSSLLDALTDVGSFQVLVYGMLLGYDFIVTLLRTDVIIISGQQIGCCKESWSAQICTW